VIQDVMAAKFPDGSKKRL